MILYNKGDSIKINISKKDMISMKILLIAGLPINEPITLYGPFVMNTSEEIEQSIDDYRNRVFGKISVEKFNILKFGRK